MIDLLPPKEKGIFLAEQEKKIIIILWFLILFFVVCLILILLSIRIYLNSQTGFQGSLLAENEREFLKSEAQEIQDKIELGNSKFIVLNSFYDHKIYFSEFLEKISQTMPQTFYLTDASFIFSEEKIKDKNGKKTGEIERKVAILISGLAPLREDLLQFKKNLENQEEFKEISFPASNWVEATNIKFHVTFKVRPDL